MWIGKVSHERAVLLLAHDLAAALTVGDRVRIIGAAVALSDVTAEIATQQLMRGEIDVDEAVGLARIRCFLP